jgi:DNA helicase-2/ATP-dependent DNA helicase PcrA
MTLPTATSANDIDNGVDAEIQACLNLDHLKSFFLYAGAGSGKTPLARQCSSVDT